MRRPGVTPAGVRHPSAAPNYRALAASAVGAGATSAAAGLRSAAEPPRQREWRDCRWLRRRRYSRVRRAELARVLHCVTTATVGHWTFRAGSSCGNRPRIREPAGAMPRIKDGAKSRSKRAWFGL